MNNYVTINYYKYRTLFDNYSTSAGRVRKYARTINDHDVLVADPARRTRARIALLVPSDDTYEPGYGTISTIRTHFDDYGHCTITMNDGTTYNMALTQPMEIRLLDPAGKKFVCLLDLVEIL